ncbi:MAG: hypothetical protein ACQEVT_16080 [Pseudomonadota bacterium]
MVDRIDTSTVFDSRRKRVMTKAASGAREFLNLMNSEGPESERQFTYDGVQLATRDKKSGVEVQPENLDKHLPRNDLSLTVGGRRGFRTAIGLDNRIRIFRLNITGRSCDLELRRADVRQLVVSGDAHRLTLSDCRILELNLDNCAEVLIENCQIGGLIFDENAKLGDISITTRTHICEFWVPEKFTLRDLKLIDIRFSTTNEKKLEIGHTTSPRLPRLDRQSFGNLLTWSETAKNSEVAHIARSNELAIELSQSKGLEKVILWLWKVSGNFGLSPTRSLLFLVAGMLLYSGLLYCQGSVLGYHPTGGWQSSLEGDASGIQIKRAIVGALQNTFSPFSVFSPRKLIVPANGIGAVGQFIQAVNTITMALITGFALRRRFRIP